MHINLSEVTNRRMFSKILTSMNLSPKTTHESSGVDTHAHSLKLAAKSAYSTISSFGNSVSKSIEKAYFAAIEQTRVFFSTKQTWHTRAIAKLDVYDTKLETWFRQKYPSISSRQDQIDQLGKTIRSQFSNLSRYNAWLRSDETTGSLSRDTAMYLVRLPLRALHNIVTLFYIVIKEILFAIAHPMKAVIQTARQIVIFIYDLTQPETWSKIGASIIGSEVAQMLILTNPILPISVGIGIFVLVGGLCVGALRAAVLSKDHEEEAASEYLLRQSKVIPENFLTSFFIGIAMGRMEKTIAPHVGASEEARNVADKYIQKHNLPSRSVNRVHRTRHQTHQFA